LDRSSPTEIRLDPLRCVRRAQPLEGGQGVAIAWALGQYAAPEFRGACRVATRFGQDCEVAAGQMAVDAHVHADELLGPTKRQDPSPAPLGTREIARAVPHHSLAKDQLGIVGVDTQSFRANRHGLLRLVEHLVRPGDERV
jgi:hypothetical protein